MKQGIQFVPARLTQKRPKDTEDEVSQGRPSKKGSGGGVWEPSSSDDDGSDSEDSMSDLYPCQFSSLLPCISVSLENLSLASF